MVCNPPGSSVHGILQAKILELGFHSLLQGIFPTQRLNLCLLYCRQILYYPSHQYDKIDMYIYICNLKENFLRWLHTVFPWYPQVIRSRTLQITKSTGALSPLHTVAIVVIHLNELSVQFSSVQSLSHVQLFATPWIAACQASLSITNSQSSLRLTSIKSVMPSSHLILCHPLLLLPPIPPSIGRNEAETLVLWSPHAKSWLIGNEL